MFCTFGYEIFGSDLDVVYIRKGPNNKKRLYVWRALWSCIYLLYVIIMYMKRKGGLLLFMQ